jgi:hypothetical protein
VSEPNGGPGETPTSRRRARSSDVPRIPRRAGFKVSTGQLIKIGMTLALLVMLLLVRNSCATSVSTFVTGFGDPGSGSSHRMPTPDTVDVPPANPAIDCQVPMREHLTADEWKAMVAKNTACLAAAKAAAGSGSAGSAASTGSAGSAGSSSSADSPYTAWARPSARPMISWSARPSRIATARAFSGRS